MKRRISWLTKLEAYGEAAVAFPTEVAMVVAALKGERGVGGT
jgi:hypothetical protein